MLTLQELLIETDNDQPVVISVSIGYNDDLCLVVRLEYENYDERERSYTKDAIITKEDSYKLAKALKVEMVKLPAKLCAEIGVPLNGFYLLSEACSVYNDVLDFILYHKTRYKIQKNKNKITAKSKT